MKATAFGSSTCRPWKISFGALFLFSYAFGQPSHAVASGSSPSSKYLISDRFLGKAYAVGNASPGSFLAGATTPQLRSTIPAPTPTPPIVDLKSFGAKGDGNSDDTAAIQRALNSMARGGTLVFPPGTYEVSDNIIVKHAGVKLWGYGGARIHNVRVPQLPRVSLEAPNSAMYGFKVTTVPILRKQSTNHSQIRLQSSGQEVIDNELDGSGILIKGASDFLVARNRVRNTPADSIRSAAGSRDGRILGNVVRNASDDMVSVVSTIGEPINSNILIEGNDVSMQLWGRGITVVGGEKVTIRNNIISHTFHAAGIYVAQEEVYSTYHVKNILVEGNKVFHVQTTGIPKRATRTRHGGIHINSSNSSKKIEYVMIRDNLVDDVIDDGIKIDKHSCRIGIVGNQLFNIPGESISLSKGINSACNIACSNNSFDGASVSNSRCGGSFPVVSGYVPRLDRIHDARAPCRSALCWMSFLGK